MSVLRRILIFTKKYPVIRGMLMYAVTWPASNICQQFISGKKVEELNLQQAARFSIYGCCYVAPTLYTWVKIAGVLFPNATLGAAVGKALVEQLTYSPFAICSFYMVISFLEGANLDEMINEVKSKFLSTYKIGLCVWPIVQTINFAFVREKNRVPVVGVVSFMWTVFLSYMKQLEMEQKIKDAQKT